MSDQPANAESILPLSRGAPPDHRVEVDVAVEPDVVRSPKARRRGVSVRYLLALTSCVAMALAALMEPASLWAPALTNLNLAAELAAVLGAIYLRGPQRAFAFGFALCNGAFLALEFFPEWGRPITHRLLAWLLWSPDSQMRIGEPSYDRAYVGMMITAFVYGYGGGVLARRFARRTAQQEE